MGMELEDHWDYAQSAPPETLSPTQDAIVKFWETLDDDKISPLVAINPLIAKALYATADEQESINEIISVISKDYPEKAQKLREKISTSARVKVLTNEHS